MAAAPHQHARKEGAGDAAAARELLPRTGGAQGPCSSLPVQQERGREEAWRRRSEGGRGRYRDREGESEKRLLDRWMEASVEKREKKIGENCLGTVPRAGHPADLCWMADAWRPGDESNRSR